MQLKQISVFLENKPGALTVPCHLLGQAGINIQTFALADTRQFGILRLMVQDWAKASAVLEQNGCLVQITDVVVVEVPDHPGGLGDVLAVLQKASINVEYMYAFTCKAQGNGLLVFRFDNSDGAIAALQRAGFNVADAAEVSRHMTLETSAD